jgi:NPCBM/NEW2 domain
MKNLSLKHVFLEVPFIIKCDDKEVFRTEVVKDWAERPFEINLTGVNRLELISDSHGFSWGDEAAWYSPMLKR